MRTQTFKFINISDSVATYPDEMCFAFNPNYVEIESAWQSATLTVVVSRVSGTATIDEQSIKVAMYKGKAKVYLSRLFELMFDDPQNTRCVEIFVSVRVSTLELFNFTTLAIWGNLAMGERFGNLGVFNRDTDKRYYERNLIWFRQFPFTVSLFRYNQEVEFYGRYDGNVYSPDPIYRDTKVCFFEKIEKLAPSLPIITSGTAQLPFQIIYYAQLRRFVALKDGKYYANWIGDETEHFGNTSDYCDSSNELKPQSDVTYLLETSNGFARYRFMSDELVYCGMFTDLGFEDIPVARVFPKAQRKATIKYKVNEENRLWFVFDKTFDYTFKYKVNEENRLWPVFDKTFDYTFFQSYENLCLINLIVNDDTAGHYLRWIDRQGNLQYFLFSKGTKTYKNKLGSDTVLDSKPINGMYFANHTRTRNLECTITHNCCAVHLPDDIYAYVATILTSPLVDLYLGKDESGDDIWQPVNIQASSVNHNPKMQLNDLEFSFAIPGINAQSL